MKNPKEISLAIQQAKKGEDVAYTLLLNTYWKDVYRFQLSKTKDEDEAEDITIKTFAKAFDRIATFDEQYKFKTWLLSISKNIYIDHLRKQKTETVSLSKEDDAYKVKDDEPSPVDKLIIEQNLAQLLAYIKQLKPHYQEIINLRFFQEMSYKEIANRLEEPMNNVKVKLLRAKKLLAEIIKKG
jgi:RNA polymerase sigma-70 factor (ECF subfamily)